MTEFERAAEAIRRADALLITAGAGMGVDSGLPDFRGPEGFWRAYPAFRELGVRFEEAANPRWFRSDPALAWGFYGHRLNLYRDTRPHAGFAILRRWVERAPRGAFVFTSNVDGHFQRSGFDPSRVVECHGSLFATQCVDACTGEIRDATEVHIDVDDATLRAREPLPRCPRCGALARPNVLMFGDAGWIPHRTAAQWERYEAWLDDVQDAAVVVVECGAGTAVPTVRIESERRADGLVRINPREDRVPPGGIAIRAGAREALEAIDRQLSGPK